MNILAVAGMGKGKKWVVSPLASASVALVLTAALAFLGLSGCASKPISKDVREQAQPVTFDQVRADPQGTRGTVVVWGGKIINVVNETNGSSVYIVALPLKSDEKPNSQGPSSGRFIAAAPTFLDSEMLPHGQKITVAGSLSGVRTEELGNMQYAYPVVELKELHVWPTKAEEESNYPYYGYYGTDWDYWGWGWGPGWGWYGGLYYPGYYHGGHGFHGGFHDHGGFHGEHGGGGFHESGGGFHGGGGFGGGGFHGGGGGGGHGR